MRRRHESELAAATGELPPRIPSSRRSARLETAASEQASLEEQLAAAHAGPPNRRTETRRDGDGEDTRARADGASRRARARTEPRPTPPAALRLARGATPRHHTSSQALKEKIAAAGGLGNSGASEDELESLREQVAYGEALAADLAWQVDELRTAGDVAENALALRAAEVELLTLALREMGEGAGAR